MCHSDLAATATVTSQPTQLDQQEDYNIWVVQTLYQALNSFEVETVHRFVTPDLEWWFHGPPIHQYLMRTLTGDYNSFNFAPISIAAFGSTVIVEGHSKEHKVSWVHAWTVNEGIITQVREYFNTSVIVTRFGDAERSPLPPSQSISSSTVNCLRLWQSKLCDNNSVPGLVLAL